MFISGPLDLLHQILAPYKRLVVKINYVKAVVYIRFIGSHKAYDAIDAEEV